VLQIPRWAALRWLSFVVFGVYEDSMPSNDVVWGIASAPPVGWVALVAFLLFLRVIPFLN